MPHQRRRTLRVLWCSLVAVGTALFAAGEDTRAETATCNHADAVFYTGNETTGRLVGKLKDASSSCTDYYLSVTPRTAAATPGWPRGGTPLDAIHNAGSNFHAMAEIRLTPWAAYASEPGHSWYGAGVRVREIMKEVGYDPARADSWAVNELGEPASHAMGEDVTRGVPGARQNFRDFVRGLHDGDGTPMKGLVFAADPIQASTDLAQYRDDLESWYADSAFWDGLDDYVRFWAQETYADVRDWGVPGTTLAQRTAYLNDYFMHGLRLATDRGAHTGAARAFLAETYTPVGNASYRAPPPDAIGFGSTDVDLPTMLNFVSTQAYALRTSGLNRFGFADQRFPPAVVAPVEERLAAAIKESENDPSGACGTGGEWCDSSVAGAAFNGLWRELGTPTPPTVVPHVEGPLGANGWYTGDVTVTWSVEDLESPISSASGCDATGIDADTPGKTLTCTATSFGDTNSVSVTVKRDATPPAVTCEPTPSMLWPPNHRLVPVAIAVTTDDETSGPGVLELRETSSSDPGAGSDIRGFEVGEPDVEGFLRAERRPASSGRAYVLTYVAHDAAGNAAGCAARVIVPHDQGT